MGTEITKYDKEWGEQAKAFAEKERIAGNTITHRGGKFKVGEDMEFPELCVIILADIYENSYYAGKFDPTAMVPPTCYAFGEEEEGMAPHPSMQSAPEFFEPQSVDCASCPMNQWGSADTGRGKACKNARRMSVIPAGVYSERKGSRDLDLELYIGEDSKENEEHILHAEAYTLKVPPMSIREYKKYVQLCSSEHSRPPAGVVTRIYIEPMDKGGHKLVFEPIELLPDDLYPAVSERSEAVKPTLTQPYSPPDEEDEGAKKSKGVNRLKGLRKNRG